MPKTPIDQRSIDALRILAMDAVQAAGSGHPGMPMGMADVAYVLWMRHLRHNPSNPSWINRDRFILSAGHGAILLYSLLHLTGYPISLDDLKRFRVWGSPTPGHPEFHRDLGIEVTTGPLGQGFANGVGMAIAQAHLNLRFNRLGYRIFDHDVYAFVSDGDLMEGITHEAASLAGHLGLERLIYFYDSNQITNEGKTGLTFTENVAARFRAYGWHVQDIDGHDFDAIDAAIPAARNVAGKPHLVICRTHIAYGSPNKQDSAAAHGAPLGPEEVRLTREALGWPHDEPFLAPEEIRAHFNVAAARGAQLEAKWQELAACYRHEYPEEARLLDRLKQGDLPSGWEQALPRFKVNAGPLATRTASGQVLNALADVLPELIGGSADLAPATRTYLQDHGAFQRSTREGRNLHFGVREHAMGGILNGMALYGGLRVYGGTFLVFSDYLRPALRLAALMQAPVTYAFTHDSIFVGEDGPTHQPVEHLVSLRAMPGLLVIRPADANETAAAWKVALEHRGPVALILSRQKLPVIPETYDKALEGVAQGAYVLRDASRERIDLILIATGSEVALALEAQRLLEAAKISTRVVSMPSWELFEAQSLFYRLGVLPPSATKRLAIEAGSPLGWRRFVGDQGDVIGIDRFGASAAEQTLHEQFGFTATRIADRARRLMVI
ncbi:MAG: transketolase [Anaerolineae bacterium]|nr:transketolase [Anaerolineae bacterium]